MDMTGGTVYVNPNMVLDLINNKKLKNAWRTAFLLIQNIETHNIITTSVAEMAEQMDVKASAFRADLQALADVGVLELRKDPDHIVISPEFAWKGSSQTHMDALNKIKQ
jgi:predicted double-glycine peptidase